MHYDIIIIGGGAAGLMAAYGAASHPGGKRSVLVLEKMPRPGRKIMITGKGRCNFTNVKDWAPFSSHIRANANVLRPSFYNLTPQKLIDLFASSGLESEVERGDRAFPASHRAVDVVDALVGMAARAGAGIETGAEVRNVCLEEEYGEKFFSVDCRDGRHFSSAKLIIATGGLSYPATGSTGDGYRIAESFGHTVKNCFPSLTALVPKGYKLIEGKVEDGHIDRAEPLSETGKSLCGVQLENVGVALTVNGNIAREMEGDLDFTDGGIEGPAGFSVSRDAVKAIVNGGKVSVIIDLKPAVTEPQLLSRVECLWKSVREDSRSRGKSQRQLLRILLGKVMPWELVPGFIGTSPALFSGKNGREQLKVNVLVSALKCWKFDIAGYVGYERCVVTAGGVACDEIIPKTLESRKIPGLYFCGEVLDIDADTGGYNLHTAFSTGCLAGISASKALSAERR